MRLAVLGTSNSIGPAGYVRGLTASGLFSAIDNYSLGASTTVAFPFSLSRFNPSSYDACIFDFAVNEEILLHNHPSAAIEIEARLLGVLEHFCDSNCLPIFLILPSRFALANKALARDLYISFARKHGLPYFDGFQLLSRFREYAKLSEEACFRDPDHIIQWASGALGVLFAERIAEALNRRIAWSTTTADVHAFSYLRASEYLSPNKKRVQRQNSLIETTFVQLRGEGEEEIQNSSSGRLIGLGFNVAYTDGIFEVRSGSALTVMDCGVKYFDHSGEKMIFAIRPLGNPSNLAPEILLKWRARRDAEQEPVIELHGLSIEMPARASRILVIASDAVDLVAAIPESVCRLVGTAVGTSVIKR